MESGVIFKGREVLILDSMTEDMESRTRRPLRHRKNMPAGKRNWLARVSIGQRRMTILNNLQIMQCVCRASRCKPKKTLKQP